MSTDYTLAHNLLPFVARFVQSESSYEEIRVELVADGTMRFRLQQAGREMVVDWTEHRQGLEIEVSARHGSFSLKSSGDPAPPAEAIAGAIAGAMAGAKDETHPKALRQVCNHVARRVGRLMRGNPPHLLCFRNRNPQRIQWTTRMFNSLCPDLIRKGQTRYFDYRVSNLDEYEGFINVEFQSRNATVVLRLILSDRLQEEPVVSFGPMALTVLHDDRDEAQKRHPEHRVEDFFGYVLSRNLPPQYVLEFEFDDPPADYLPPDLNVDFLRVKRLDDTSFFEMLLSTSADVGVVTSCDRECFNLFSMVSAKRETYTTITPWQNQTTANYLQHCYNVNLTGAQTVMGDSAIEQCLDTVAHTDQPPGLLIFFDSCLHRLIGEDIEGQLTQFRASSDTKLIYYDIRTTQNPYMEEMRDFWCNIYRAVAEVRKPQPGRVCFLGFGPEASDEMDQILANLGVEVGGRIFPHLHHQHIREIQAASLIVQNAWEYVEIIFEDMLKLLDRPVINLPLPYGIEASHRFYAALTGRLGGQRADPTQLPRVAQLCAAFAQERAEIAGQRIGLFVRHLAVADHLSHKKRFGVDLLSFLRELGLGIDLNLYVEPGEEVDEAAVSQALGLDLSGHDSIGLFHHFGELPQRMAQGDFGIVYTETYRDERITAGGKSPLTLHQLQPGYGGALRTVRMVASILKAGFHARFRHHWTGPYEHYRTEES